MSTSPSDAVLAAFGASLPAVRVSGGQETTWKASPTVILKPLDMSMEALQWQASIFPSLTNREDIRLSTPRKASDGALVIQGWTAWDYINKTARCFQRLMSSCLLGNRDIASQCTYEWLVCSEYDYAPLQPI
ncbi:hypothetical protein M422DRAFT_240975 [Sphaerobolus stellatus SS14]|nr:hypothetical protein M422DRAFT_240975 [Sphaerobolus stellatus SS14]